jgi:hypothetical protein
VCPGAGKRPSEKNISTQSSKNPLRKLPEKHRYGQTPRIRHLCRAFLTALASTFIYSRHKQAQERIEKSEALMSRKAR